MSASLALTDGLNWTVSGRGEAAGHIVKRLKLTMGMACSAETANRHLIISTANRRSAPVSTAEDTQRWHIRLAPPDSDDMLGVQLAWLAYFMASHSILNGGLLVHGALAVAGGKGIVLAGPAGIGKTTASRRLPPPWQPLCDDAALIVRRPQGGYAAHPWPTWSRFTFGGKGGSWPVAASHDLNTIFFLTRSKTPPVLARASAQAAVQLAASCEQVSRCRPHWMGRESMIALRRKSFQNSIDLAQTVPCRFLSLTNGFADQLHRLATER